MNIVFKLFFVVFALVFSAWADVCVTNVTAQQRYPWNGKVDIVVTLIGASNDVADAYCTFIATNSATMQPISILNISQNGTDTGSDTTWTRRFVWNATADVGSVMIDDVALTVEVKTGGVQLWENGPYWAECNVGASKPEEYGYYFWWGDTVGYTRSGGTWVSSTGTQMSSSPFGSCPTYGKTTSQLQSLGYIDSTGNLTADHDAATKHWGAPWRMPTDADFAALISNCTTTWITTNGVYGRLVTGKGDYASKSIFLPAAGRGCDSGLSSPGSYGYYWSSTPNSDYSNYAWRLNFDSSYFDRSGYGSRCSGQAVRPLREFAQ